MADYKGLTIKFRGDTTDATKAIHILLEEAKVAQGNLAGVQGALDNLATNGEKLNDALKADALKNMGTSAQVAQERFEALQQVLPQLRDRLADLQGQIESKRLSLADAIADDDGTKEAQLAISSLEGQLNSLEEQERRTAAEIERTSTNLLTAESAARAAASAHEMYEAALAASQSKLGQFAESAKTTGDNLKSIGDSIAGVGDKMTLVSGAVLATFGRNMVSTTEDFGNAISQLGGYLDISGAQLESMSDQALQWGADTQFSATEAANAMNELAKGGMSQAQISGGAMAATMELAAAGGLDMATAAETAVQAMNVFKMDAADASSVADALAGAANKSTAEVSDLAAAFSQIGGAASMAGWDLNEVTGALALLADRGFSGSEAGTTLKTMLQRLASPTKKAAETMDALGIEVYDAQGNMVDAIEVVRQFESALANLTDEQKNKALLDIFGMRGVNGMSAMIDETSAKFQEYIEATEQVGYANEMAQARMGDLGWALEKLRGEAETAVVSLGNALTPTIIDVAEALEGALSWFNNLDGGTQTFIANMGLAAVAVGPVLSVVGHLTSGIGGMISAVGTGAQTIATFAELSKGGGEGVKLMAEALALTTTPLSNTATGMAKAAEKAAALEAGFKSLATGIGIAAAAWLAVDLFGEFDEYVKDVSRLNEATWDLSTTLSGITSNVDTDGLDNVRTSFIEIRDASRELTQSQIDLKDEISDSFQSIANDASMMDDYVRTIDELRDKSNLTAGEQERLKSAVDGFNSIAGTSIEVIDQQNGKLDASEEAINRVRDAWEKYAETQATMTAYEKLKEQMVENEAEIARLTEEIDKADKGWGIWLGDLELIGDLDHLFDSMHGGGPSAALHEMEKQLEAAQERAESYSTDLEFLEGKMGDLSMSTEDYNKVLEETGTAADDAADAADDDADALDDLAESAEDAAEAQKQLRRDIEDATTELKRQQEEAYTTAKRQAEDDYNTAKAGYDKKYDELKSSLDRDYKTKADAYKRDEDALKEANSRAESELKASLDKAYDLQKQAFKEEYDLRKQAYADELAALKSAMSEEYELRKSELDREYSDAKDTFSKQETQLRDYLSKQLSAQKDAYSKQLAAYKKQLASMEAVQKESNDKRLAEMASAHSEEESILKKSLDSQYEIRKKEYAKVYKQWQKENSRLLKEAKAANKAETDAFKQATKDRIASIKAEYEERKRLYELNDGRAEIDAQIKAIEDQQAAEDEARKQRERAEKTAELRTAVEQAKTKRTREDAEKALSDYLRQLAEEDADAERERQIQALKDKRDGIAEQTAIVQEGMDAERDARIAAYEEQREIELAALEERQNAAYELLTEKLNEELELRKEKQDEALEQYREGLNDQLSAMQEAHKRERDELSSQLSGQLETLKEQNAARAEAMAEWQSRMLDRMSEANAAEIERVKGINSQTLEQIKTTNEQELRNLKSMQDSQLADLASMQESELNGLAARQSTELENLKTSQQRELQSAKDTNATNLQRLKDTNDTSLQSIKSSNDQILQKMKSDNDTALTDLKRKQDDALTKMKRDQDDAVTKLKRDMEDGKTSVETNSRAAADAAISESDRAARGVEQNLDGVDSRSSGRNIIDGLDGGIRENAYKVYNTAQEIANNVAERIRNTLQISSPSKRTREYGRFTAAGLVEGMADGRRDVVLAAQSMADDMAVALEVDGDIVSQAGRVIDEYARTLEAESLRSDVPPIDGLDVDSLHRRGDAYLSDYRAMLSSIELVAKEHACRMAELSSWGAGGGRASFDSASIVRGITDALASTVANMRGGGLTVNVAELVVREEADIDRISERLYAYQRRSERGSLR